MKWLERRRKRQREMPDYSKRVYCEECIWWGGRASALRSTSPDFECECPERSDFPWWDRRTSASDCCYVGERAESPPHPPLSTILKYLEETAVDGPGEHVPFTRGQWRELIRRAENLECAVEVAAMIAERSKEDSNDEDRT